MPVFILRSMKEISKKCLAQKYVDDIPYKMHQLKF